MATRLLNIGLSAKYYDRVSQGRVFFAANPGVQALSVNSTTATGLIIANPVTSGVNLVLLQLCIAIASAPAAQANLALTGNILTTANAATTHTTPLIVKNALIGSPFAVGAGLVDAAATVPTPAVVRPIGGGPVATGTIASAYIREDLDGLIILSPGCVISLQSLTTAISVVAGIYFEEVPVS